MVRLLFFGPLGDLMGRTTMAAGPVGETRLADFLADLGARDARFAAALAGARLRYAVNEEIVGADATVRDGDEIAFLPPFSGG